ncbi:MAG: DUF116 domain-containing protein [Chitinispirillaceae bacterium]|nr:DUF116 domain-containing protein [Chitinispirillaceae bacterium]
MDTSLKSNTPVLTARKESTWRSWWTMATFLGACWISLCILAGIEAATFYLVQPRLAAINPVFVTILGAAMLAFFIVPFAGLTLITITALSGIDLLYPHGRASITVKVLFPIAATLAQFCGINRNRLRTSFVKVNNALTIAQRKRIKGDRILVLLPHCLQIDICNRKLTNNVNNCVRCGRCAVGPLVTLGEQYGLHIEVVNGGTLARQRVASFKPSGIIAVACERDLTFGIQDVHPVPVYGVINDRPNGPCFNTGVDMGMVEEAIKFFKQNGAC